jgi:hypothetical protein
VSALPLVPLHPSVDATLRAAQAITGMEATFLGRLTDDVFAFSRVLHVAGSDWQGPVDEQQLPRTDSMCHRMLATAVHHTADAPHDTFFLDAPVVAELGITSYVGVPVTLDDGTLWGTLCGIDRGIVEIADVAVDALGHLADVMASHLQGPADLTVARSHGTWRVVGQPLPDLVSAMVLSDLIAAELDELSPGNRPERGAEPRDEVERLSLTVRQLERALSARVTIEQAIGVMSERRRITPRQAFEQLRGVARGSGRKVHDLAQEIVRSATSAQDLPSGLQRGAPAVAGHTPGVPSPAAVARAIKG